MTPPNAIMFLVVPTPPAKSKFNLPTPHITYSY